jgi:hypothetical protein
MAWENPVALVVEDASRRKGGYPTYSSEYGESFGYNYRTRGNFLRSEYKSTNDLNPLQAKPRKLEFVPALSRYDCLGHKKRYPERLPYRETSKESFQTVHFPPTAPRHPYSFGKYKVEPLARDRAPVPSKYYYYDWNVPPSEKDIYRHPTKELEEQLRKQNASAPSQDQQHLPPVPASKEQGEVLQKSASQPDMHQQTVVVEEEQRAESPPRRNQYDFTHTRSFQKPPPSLFQQY